MRKMVFAILIGAVLLSSNVWLYAKKTGSSKSEGVRSAEMGERHRVGAVEKHKGARDADAQDTGAEQGRDKSKSEGARVAGTEEQRRVGAVEKHKGARDADAQDTGVSRGVDKGLALGAEHEQQIRALQQQMTHEQAKHSSRVARLNRIRELALKEADMRTIERVDKLLEKENRRFGSKSKRMTEKLDRVHKLKTEAEREIQEPQK